MRPPPAIRSARLEDLARIRALDTQAYGDEAYGHTTLSQYHDLFPDLLVVAGVDGQVGGYALGALAAGAEWGLLAALVVDPAYQGRGLGAALARHLLDALAAHAVREVRLTVHPDNVRAQQLYVRLGFAATGRRVGYYGPGTEALEMRWTVGGGSP